MVVPCVLFPLGSTEVHQFPMPWCQSRATGQKGHETIKHPAQPSRARLRNAEQQLALCQEIRSSVDHGRGCPIPPLMAPSCCGGGACLGGMGMGLLMGNTLVFLQRTGPLPVYLFAQKGGRAAIDRLYGQIKSGWLGSLPAPSPTGGRRALWGLPSSTGRPRDRVLQLRGCRLDWLPALVHGRLGYGQSSWEVLFSTTLPWLPSYLSPSAGAPLCFMAAYRPASLSGQKPQGDAFASGWIWPRSDTTVGSREPGSRESVQGCLVPAPGEKRAR